MSKVSKAAPVAVIVILMGIWEIIVRVAGIPLYVLPAPGDMLKSFASEFPTLLGHAGITVMEAAAGMAISFVVGIVVGVLIDAMPTIKSYAPKILTVVLMCFFPIVVSFSDGLGEMEEGYLNLVRTYGGSRLQLYRIVKIPSAMISLLSGLKVAATYSISGAVVGEWIASQSGLGYYLIRAKNGYMLDKVFACVLMIILLSLLMNGLVKLFGYAVLPSARRRRNS